MSQINSTHNLQSMTQQNWIPSMSWGRGILQSSHSWKTLVEVLFVVMKGREKHNEAHVYEQKNSLMQVLTIFVFIQYHQTHDSIKKERC